MGIKESELYELNYNSIGTYDGEYLVLPINQAITHAVHRFFSPKIIPVFLGISRDASVICQEEIEYFKQFEPIGCRDEFTFFALRNGGVRAYLNGCITATFDTRKKTEKQDIIYLIDAPSFAVESMPSELKENAVSMENMEYLIPQERFKDSSLTEFVLRRYEGIRDTARLVVTSRMHIAVPCLAMGIPVVFAKENIDYRLAWLDKWIPLYSRKDAKQILWNPEPVAFDIQKAKMEDLACKRIRKTLEQWQEECEISDYFEIRTRSKYAIPTCSQRGIDFIEANWSKDSHINYAFWGENDASERLYWHITRNYPNASYVAFYDTYKDIIYHGQKRQHPDAILSDTDEFIFVTGYTASYAAKELFERIGKREDTYFIF